MGEVKVRWWSRVDADTLLTVVIMAVYVTMLVRQVNGGMPVMVRARVLRAATRVCQVVAYHAGRAGLAAEHAYYVAVENARL